MKWKIILVALLAFESSMAQSFRFKTYTTKDGLSSNDTKAALRDGNGFLWIATGNGLNRFDGNAFDHFYHNPKDKHSIASNEIVSLYTDRKKNLWIGSVAGISQYDAVQQRFFNYYPDSSNGKCGRWFVSMLEDKAGKLWVGSWYELLIFDTATKKFQRSGWSDFSAANKPVKGNNNRIVVLSLLRKSQDEMWVLTTYGLYSVNTDTKKFTWYPYPGVDDYYGCQLNYIDDTGSPWIGTYNHGILCYNISSGTWDKYLPPVSWNSIPDFNWSYGITPYNGDTLLYISLDGPAFFNKKTKQFITHINNEGERFSPASAFSICSDRNYFWVIAVSGLIKMYRAESPFKKTTPFGDGTYINRVYAVEDSPGESIVYNSKTKQVVRWNEGAAKAIPILTETGKFISSDLTGWHQQRKKAWLSTSEAFYSYDVSANKARLVKLPPPVFAANDLAVRSAVTDRNGKIWIRLRTQGIVRYDPLSDTASFVQFIPPKLESSYAALYYNPLQHCLWIAIEHQGLYQYNITSKQTKHFPLYQQPGVNAATITAIAGLPDGDMYMSDANNGFFFFNAQNESFTQLSRQDGLPGNNCNSLVIDKKGAVWIATMQGLSRYDPGTKFFMNFSTDEVLPGHVDFVSTTDGENIYSCYNKNLLKWSIAAIPSAIPDAQLYTRYITINQKPVAIAHSFKLHHTENNITIRVGILSESLYSNLDFEYSVNSEVDWIKMGSAHAINFSSLAPGNYTIKARQKGNANVLTLHIEIKPPIWKTNWFIALSSAVLLITILLVTRRRIRNIRKQAMLKQKVAETEMMALRAQMNPHFIFNCISSIDNFIQDNDKENASAWLNKFAKLIRSILDSSKNEVVPFWKDWETLQLYLELEQLRSDKKFIVQMEADESLLNGHYRIPPLLVQPYVENAIHHGLLHRDDKSGILKIHAALRNNQLIYTIEDNGIGRKKADELNGISRLNHNSYGLQMSRERIDLFNQERKNNVKITDLGGTEGNASGTKVEIMLYV